MAKILISSIILPPWNSRISNADSPEEKAETESLAETIKKDGQLQPIEVEDMGNGSYILVYGTRRRAALILNGSTEIDATIRPLSNDNERAVRNIIENIKRKNLSGYEEARVFARMRAMGLKNNEVAQRLGVSFQKVSNLATCMEKLPEPIIAVWRETTHPHHEIATDTFLRELATDKTFPTPEKKMEAWDARVREVAASGKAPGVRGEGQAPDAEKVAAESPTNGAGAGGTKGYPVSQKRIGYLIDVLGTAAKSPELSKDVRNWGAALVSFLIQGREAPPSGVPPMPVVVKPVPLTEEQKAAAKALKAAENAEKKAAELKLKAAEASKVAKNAPKALAAVK